MTKVNITYDMDEEQDKHDFKHAIKATDMNIALYDIAAELRAVCKHGLLKGRELTEGELEVAEHFKSHFWEIMNEYNLDPFEN